MNYPSRLVFGIALLVALSVIFVERLPAAPTPRAILPTMTPVDAERVQADAEAAERAGKWDRALDHYFKLYSNGHNTTELRDRIRYCLRNASQIHRHRDPAFQQFILSLSPSDSLNLYVEAITKMHTLYTDRQKASVDRLFLNGLQELDRAIMDPAFRLAHMPEVNELKLTKFRELIREGWQQKLPNTPREARLAAREVLAAAQSQLGMKNGSALVLEFLCGACAGLDEYSSYQTATGAGEMIGHPVLELAAFGMLVTLENGLVVDGMIPGSWAARHTTLKKGDRIVTLNGKDMTKATGLAFAAAVKVPLTPTGHEIEVPTTLIAQATTQKIRLPLPVPSVYATEMIGTREGIGYVRVSMFKESTAREMDDAVEALKLRGLRGLVIDLRGNAGGSFQAAVDLSKRFLASGVIVTTHGQIQEFANGIYPADAMTVYDMPVVLLVDTRTMSAAEVFAAALKDNDRATLIGMTTFGKGLIQCPVRLRALDGDDARSNKSGHLLLSVGSAFGPRGNALNGTGIAPHVIEPDAARHVELAISKLTDLLGPAAMTMTLPTDMMH